MSLLLSGKLQTLLDRLTSTLATNLSTRVDTTISSRQSEANASSRYSTLNGKIDTVDGNVDTILARVPSTVASSSALATTDGVVDNIYARQFGFRAPTRNTDRNLTGYYIPSALTSIVGHGLSVGTGLTSTNSTLINLTGPILVLAVGVMNSDTTYSESGVYATLTIDGNTVATLTDEGLFAAQSSTVYRGYNFNGGAWTLNGDMVLPPVPWIVTSSLTMTGYCDDTLGANASAYCLYLNM